MLIKVTLLNFSIQETHNGTIWQHWTMIMIITRPSILCVTHQMSRKKRNYSVGWTVPYKMMNYKWCLMNIEFIWLTSLNAIQIKVSSALAYNFNQLRKAVGALSRRFRPLPCPANILAMTRPALPFPIHSCFVLAPVQNINRVSYEFPIKRRCFCATV